MTHQPGQYGPATKLAQAFINSKLTQLSITDALKDDFKKNLQLELTR